PLRFEGAEFEFGQETHTPLPRVPQRLLVGINTWGENDRVEGGEIGIRPKHGFHAGALEFGHRGPEVLRAPKIDGDHVRTTRAQEMAGRDARTSEAHDRDPLSEPKRFRADRGFT